MTSISLRGHVTGDGTLELRIPTKLPETDVEVLLVLRPVGSEDTASIAIWPEGYFDRTFGSFRDNPLTREPPPEFELRQELR